MLIQNNKTAFCFALYVAVFFFATTHIVQAETVKEHPDVLPFPGSVLAEKMSKYNKFNSAQFYRTHPQTKKKETINVKGEYYYLLYEVRTASGDRVRDISKTEFFEHFRKTAKGKGGEIIYEDQSYLIFSIPGNQGSKVWCKLNVTANMGQQYVLIVDEKSSEPEMSSGTSFQEKNAPEQPYYSNHAVNVSGKTSGIRYVDQTTVTVPENELVKLSLPSTTPLADIQHVRPDIELKTEDKKISVTSPGKDEHWMGGNSYRISWSGAHTDSMVKIDLVYVAPTHEKVLEIASSTENDGSFEYLLPVGISWKHWHNRIRVSSPDDSAEGFSKALSVFTDDVDIECRIMNVKQAWERDFYVVYSERDEWLEFEIWLRNLGIKKPVNIQTVVVRLVKEPENVVVFQEEWGFSNIYPIVWYKTPEPRKVNISNFRMWKDLTENVNLNSGSYRLDVEVDPDNRLGENAAFRDNNKDVKFFRIK
ncbi:hypothetical protein JCM14469_15590 [Desulfatiferula olefinivorans]